MKNTFIGGVLGIFLMIAVILVRFLMDDTVKTPEDVEKYLQLSTLAVIPLNEGEEDGRRKRKSKEASASSGENAADSTGRIEASKRGRKEYRRDGCFSAVVLCGKQKTMSGKCTDVTYQRRING